MPILLSRPAAPVNARINRHATIQILHRTFYNFSGEVQLGPHFLRVRPKESHDLRIESSTLNITPAATLRWYRDVEDNSVAVATFCSPASQLAIESELIIEQYNETPLDFLVDQDATQYPFAYDAEDKKVLAPYLRVSRLPLHNPLVKWVSMSWRSSEPIQTYTLLERLCQRIHESFAYQMREEAGVQSAEETLARQTGSCRDFATLFMESARHLGLATHFVSGYLFSEPSQNNYGSTHAWSEVFIPGAGWIGFDPTIGKIVGIDHFSIAVARLPESVPPVEGSFTGPPGANLDVGVWVTALN